jgi:DNA-directed RNA polymerase specialized sigma24 family protein
MTRLELASEAAMACRRDTIDTVLDRIYKRHVADVDCWARRLAGPRDDAEDLGLQGTLGWGLHVIFF